MLSYCVVVILLGSSLAVEPPVVTTNLGSIKGYHKKSFDGRTFSAFEGIPYAKPPVGKLRFEAPIESDPWIETLDAKNTYVCSHFQPVLKIASGDEDCLYLNVYLPREVPNPNDNLDVIVHIHGGGFSAGNPKFAGPLFLMDREVIFVNLNYRLGPFGFLSTEDNVVPGNNGMKDQVLALQWVQKHIKQFGGNPNSVTITGASAGGASVHLHYFSKLSKGLFHRGVSESGTALAPWAIQRGALEKAKALAVMTGCDDTTTRLLIDCMKTKLVAEILENTQKLSFAAGEFPLMLFTPVIEKSSTSSFLEDYPQKLLIDGNFHDLPWLASVCTDEGGLVFFSLYNKLHTLDAQFDQIAQHLLYYNYSTCDSDKKSIAQAIRNQYFDEKKISKETYHGIMNLYGDRMFILDFEKSTRIQASAGKSKVYSYIYGYQNSFSGELVKMFGISDLELGVGHAEDCQLLYDVRFFGDSPINSVLSEDDKLVKNMMIDMLVSFSRGEDPKIIDLSLQPVNSNPERFTYLSIKGPNKNEIDITDELSPSKFWELLPIVENDEFNQKLCRRGPVKAEL